MKTLYNFFPEYSVLVPATVFHIILEIILPYLTCEFRQLHLFNNEYCIKIYK